MTIWVPELERSATAPLYLAIADALEQDIRAGRLKPGARLPTHRELARELRVTVGTVTRSYAEASRRGLVGGEVGRGTFVRDGLGGSVSYLRGEHDDGLIDLSLNMPVGGSLERDLGGALAELAASPDLARLAGYLPNAGVLEHRAAGARWIGRAGLETAPERVLVTGGAQHAMAVVFATLCSPGDVVLTEALTYAGMKGLADILHVRLVGVEMDGEGLLPDALEAALRSYKPKALYTMPTLHNPAATVMSLERRREVARIAAAHEVPVVEDDSYGFLPEEELPPLTSFAPDTGFYLTSVSKSMTSCLRVGFLSAPPDFVERLTATLWSVTWMASPLMAEVAARWIRDGTAERMVAERRREAERRQRVLARALGGFDYRSHPQGFHAWLELPDPWRGADFVAEARARGVAVTPPEAFAVGRAEAPRAVRVCLGPEPDLERLERGLRTLDDALRGRRYPSFTPFL